MVDGQRIRAEPYRKGMYIPTQIPPLEVRRIHLKEVNEDGEDIPHSKDYIVRADASYVMGSRKAAKRGNNQEGNVYESEAYPNAYMENKVPHAALSSHRMYHGARNLPPSAGGQNYRSRMRNEVNNARIDDGTSAAYVRKT